MHVTAIIVAAGRGRRFGGGDLKQLRLVGGRAILERSVSAFAAHRAVSELVGFKAAGGGAMIDCMPCDAGRNVEKLAEISRKSGVHLVAPTGLHRVRFYPEGHWRFSRSPEALADLFADEIERGIDANDCAGPDVRRSGHRCETDESEADDAPPF